MIRGNDWMNMNIPYSVVQSNRVQEYITANHKMNEANSELQDLIRKEDQLERKIRSFWIQENGRPRQVTWTREHYDINWQQAVVLQEEISELVRIKGLVIDAKRKYEEYRSKVSELIEETKRAACCKGLVK